MARFSSNTSCSLIMFIKGIILKKILLEYNGIADRHTRFKEQDGVDDEGTVADFFFTGVFIG
jgi:hypothetical protein